MSKLNWNFKPLDTETGWENYFSDYRSQLDRRKREGVVEAVQADDVTVTSTGEVPLSSVVKMNQGGSISRQSILGKVCYLIESTDQMELKAGRSTYEKNSEIHEHSWIAAAGHGIRITASGTDIVYNGRTVTYDELEELLHDYSNRDRD